MFEEVLRDLLCSFHRAILLTKLTDLQNLQKHALNILFFPVVTVIGNNLLTAPFFSSSLVPFLALLLLPQYVYIHICLPLLVLKLQC